MQDSQSDSLQFDAAGLAAYARRWPGESAVAAAFAAQLRRGAAAFRRDGGGDGHFTGSALVLSADGTRMLLMHHRKLGRWLQPGGHADGDPDLAAVALREAAEESGLQGLRCDGRLLDLDRHLIPARGPEPEHFHYDARFVVHAGADERFRVNAEAHALAWRPIVDVVQDLALDASLRRMAAKWAAGG